jgi:hypothetical protein
MRTPVRLIVLPALAGLVLAACAAAGGASPAPASPEPDATAATPVETPGPTVKDITPRGTPVPLPTTDGEGDEAVTGVVSDVVQTVIESSTAVGDVTQFRDGVVVGTHTASDPRVTGKSKLAFNVDWYGNAGPMWATHTITTADGEWSGPCAGASALQGSLGSFSCWMAGSGAYEGWMYYQMNSSGAGTGTTEGIIYKGDAPER